MKFKRASIITKIVVLILLIYIATLLSVRSKIQAANAAYQALQAQVDEQAAANAALASDIANKDDPDTVLAIAKERMGLLESGEIIFYDTTN